MNPGPTVNYPDKLEIIPLDKPPSATIRVPGSKSITNRALVLAALTARGFVCQLRGVLQSEDTAVMMEALRVLGFRVLVDWPDSTVSVSSDRDDPVIPVPHADLFVGNSGTSMRFLTAMVSLGHGRFRLDGVPRMRERPIEDLLTALRQLGVAAASEHGNGCPPVLVDANGLNGGTVRIKGNVSSQFLSGLLLAAPFARADVAIEIDGPLVSWPYAWMTVQMIRNWGLRIRQQGKLIAQSARLTGYQCEWGARLAEQSEAVCFLVPGRQYESLPDLRKLAESGSIGHGLDPRLPWLREYDIEPDASAASYFWAAAAMTGGKVTVPGLCRKSLQGDVRFADLLRDMGCIVDDNPSELTVQGAPLHGIDADLNDISDTVMTLAAVACFADGPTTIRNVAHIRNKETDRLAALACELRKVGALVEEFSDGLTIMPRPLQGAEIDTYNDHRMAMSMALIGLRVPGIVIKDPGCVAKTYPGFWNDLEKLRT
jgi:3-phosphoshikimate 1-carboxyvinyltransferase